MPKRSRARSVGDDEKIETHTDLERQVRIPWSKQCILGGGLDAVTGEHTAASVFKTEFKYTEKWNRKTNTDTVREMYDDYDIGIGATVNVLSHPVGANANITKMLSKTASNSTILIQFKHEAHLTHASFPPNIPIQEGVQRLDETAFTERYGHYYVAGYDKVYRCCMTVKCKTKEETVTQSHALEAIAIVENYLKGGIKFSDLDKDSSKWSLLSVVVDTEGYSDHLNLSNKILDLETAPQILSEILKDKSQDGFPHAVILKHYSTLPSLQHVKRRIAIPPLNFERARVMRKLFIHLRDCCRSHPALENYPHDLRAIDDVLDRFKLTQKYLVLSGNIGESTIDELCRELQTWEKQACTIIERHSFIRSVMDMDTSIVSHPPEPVDEKYLHRWQCGRITGDKGPSGTQAIDNEATTASSLSGPLLDKSFGQCQEVFQLQWTTPNTNARTIFPPPAQEITFSTRDGVRPRVPSPELKRPSGKATKQPVVESVNAVAAESITADPLPQLLMPVNDIHSSPNTHTRVFDYYVNHKPVYVLGWTLSCYWPKRQPSPQVQAVYHQSKHILADRLAILVDTTCRARWHCTVFFVKQSEYNFPDLLGQRPAPLIEQPSPLRRLFGMNK
ncbi:FHA domain-containing protein [Favolaschia claudopus]|uniref:FHA domain-containing protein n=1 Tax=Favolaschia claudopus TaxID=2862362 RepID=A0AAW0EDK6_9AGAR